MEGWTPRGRVQNSADVVTCYSPYSQRIPVDLLASHIIPSLEAIKNLMQSLVLSTEVMYEGIHSKAVFPCLQGRHNCTDTCTHSAKPPPHFWVGQQSGERREGNLAYTTLLCITSYWTSELGKPAFKDSPRPGRWYVLHVFRLHSQLSAHPVMVVGKLPGTWLGSWQRAPWGTWSHISLTWACFWPGNINLSQCEEDSQRSGFASSPSNTSCSLRQQ